MSHKQSVEFCTSGAEFIRAVRDSDAIISQRWAGDHWTATTAQGRVTLCNSNRELPHGLRRRIAKTLVAIGLAGAVLLCVLPQLLAAGM